MGTLIVARPGFHDAPVLHHDDDIAHIGGDAEVVGDHHDGLAVVVRSS